MKKLIVKLFSLTAIAAQLTLNSCSSSDDPDPIIPAEAQVIENLNAGIMNGTLQKNFTLSSTTQYNLTGQFIVSEGAVLNIPAGTRIVADNGGTDVYLAVLKGGEININGSPGSPVVMSSLNGNHGDWGGLTICGNATTTAGVNAEAEVGGFLYGGTEDSDSSGIIKYLQIVGTGAQINPESQYNGISLYAVGSGTIIDNIAVINGSDDGIEFFGGTVNASNLYLENNDDDSIDWTEGWNGTVNNAYISHTIAGFSTVFEGDKENNNPKFYNITAISSVGGTALQFKKQSGATITNLYLDGYGTNIDMKDDGPLSNVKIDGVDANPSHEYNTGTQVDVSGWAWKNVNL